MHKSSYLNMQRFVHEHLALHAGKPLTVADIGSLDVNGSYGPLFCDPAWTYTGVDLTDGANVDVVLENPYKLPFPERHFDVVVSGQALEHVEYPWLMVAEIGRVLRAGGLSCLIAPSTGPEHRYPVDCWRIYPDGMRALAKQAGLDVIDSYAQWDKAEHLYMNPIWRDCVLIARKPEAEP